MTSQASYGSGMLFDSINEDLNASLATADELSKEFSSLLKEASSDSNDTKSQTTFTDYRERPQSSRMSNTSIWESGSSADSYISKPFYQSPTTNRSLDSVLSNNKNQPPSTVLSSTKLSSPKIKRESTSFRVESPTQSPKSQRRNSPVRNLHVPTSYMERSISPISSTLPPSPRTSSSSYSSSSTLSPYDNTQMGRRSPRIDRSPSPLAFNHTISSTLPRNLRLAEENVQRQSKWIETDLDMSYERKPHQTHDKTEWLRHAVPSSSWRESNLDGPLKPKKEFRSLPHQSYGSLPRTTRISVPPDSPSQAYSPYQPQPIISRISIPPSSAQPRQRRPIPLSVIMQLQNPHLSTYHTTVPHPREYFFSPAQQPQQRPPELRQPPVYSDALNSSDVDAELERIEVTRHLTVIDENSIVDPIKDRSAQPAPRPLSPTRLQPVVAPETQVQEMPDLEELLAIRAEIPRALKRRGSMDHSRPLKSASHYEPNQYKHLISKLFRKKERHSKGEPGSENGSSSDEEECAMPPSLPTATMPPHGYKSYHSILRKPREHKTSGRRARLNPLVLALDGALVGELDTVLRAMQEMNDPSQPNDEGITALHNAICGGHYNVVDFLVRIGANVSAPDSHGWTPLHCAASCNDRNLCEYLVRNGAAVMAVTESDGATASQKCDPYAVGFEECENFLRGVEEAMGVDNSGVLYGLWTYPAQAPDELNFKDGDMVTILQKQEGSDWWWASLCGREGFVPNNYFGLFPKVRPKTIC
ncbi:relA-associated inhibitor [Eucyclogobius newberryi]|uniref:relA-associated inhibitor n=1 Tax=Eucyclogobius newberryi TaxID=166745 RepID=UPI003B5A343D